MLLKSALSRTFFPFLLTAIALAIPIAAQSPSKILSRAAKALGGEQVLRSVTSSRRSGTITRIADGANGKFTVLTSGRNLYTCSYDIDGFEFSVGYNGKSGWRRDSKNGLRTVTGDPSRDLQAEAIYRNTGWLNAKKDKSKIIAAGTATINGKQANGVTIVTARGARMMVWFDTATGLPVKDQIGDTTFEYGDMRAVSGIETPSSIRMTVADDVYDVKLDEVAYNKPVARSEFDFPNVSNEPLPNIPALLSEIRANADKVDTILENYSFTELRIDRKADGNGGLVEKSSEKRFLTFYKGYRINRLIEKNGKTLSAADQADEDKDVAKQVADIEKRIAAKEKKEAEVRDTSSGAGGQPKNEGQRITIADALKGSLLVNPRQERLKGRDVIVFDYEPDPAFKPQTRNEKLFALCSGVVWVDKATKQIVRLEAVLTQSAGNFLAKAKRGASFTLENELVNNEIWLPSRADIDLSIKILFAGININTLIKYGDYRRFATEVTDASVGDPPKP